MKILLDENVSPSLVVRLHAKGVEATHIVHLGRAGLADSELWQLAFRRDEIVVTINAADFIELAEISELHPGLIILRVAGLTADEQWQHLEPVVDHILTAHTDLMNKAVEIWSPASFDIFDLPAPG